MLHTRKLTPQGDKPMCQTLNTIMMLGYILNKHETISFESLSRFKSRIQDLLDDIFVDISEAELYQAEKNYPNRFKIESNNDSLNICVKEKFEISFLDKCYQPFFSHEDFEEIKKILMNEE